MKEINTNHDFKHYGYPSIEQFRSVIRNVKHKAHYVGQDVNGEAIYDPSKELPTLKFQATTKIHGTNASIVFDYKNNIVYYQSRENVISPIQDNAGFATAMSKIQDILVDYANTVDRGGSDILVIFGEWCGGNIQKGVGVSGLDKMFVIFDIALINSEDPFNRRNWFIKDLICKVKFPDQKIYNIYDYKTWEFDIDFKYPELSQNKIIEVVEAVEAACPVAASFNKEGIGEGIVLKAVADGYSDSGFWFKAKGEKHQSSKVKTLVPVDVEKVNNMREFVEMVFTESRCQQSIQKLKEANKPLDRTSLGEFIRWIVNDIIKEESDTILKNGLNTKEIGGPIAAKAKEWFFKNEHNF
jgi:hypothetical protein